MNPHDSYLNTISDELLISLSNNCMNTIEQIDNRNVTKSPILIDLLAEYTREELNHEEESSTPKNCTCSYHADYDKPKNLNLSAVVSPHFKWEKQLKYLRLITWLKSCIKRESSISADDIRILIKQFSPNQKSDLRKEKDPIILKIQKKKKRISEENDDDDSDDCHVLKEIINGKEVKNNNESKKKRAKRVKKSVLPEVDLEASQCSPLMSFGEDSITGLLPMSPITSVADSGVDFQTFIDSYLFNEIGSSEESSSQSSTEKADYISFFKQPDDIKIKESPKQNDMISSDKLMLIHEKCQLDNFALTVVREFLNEFTSEKCLDNIFKNKALIVESFQTIGDFVNHLERRENKNITIAHLFIKSIMLTIKKAFDPSLHKNLTNFKAQLYVSMVLELNKSLKIFKETLDFLITQLFNSLENASQSVDIRLKKSIETHDYIILYGLEIVIKKFSTMTSCEMLSRENQDLPSKINALWRRHLIAYFDPKLSNQQTLPEEDLKEFLIANLNTLLGKYKLNNPLKAEWVLKLICLLSE